jgi:molybdopterin synthase sulfur carrier subunit
VLTVRYFAAAAEASGIEEESVPAPTDLDALLTDAVARHGAALARVLPACSVLLDGLTTTDRTTALAGVATVDLLPPFAGG